MGKAADIIKLVTLNGDMGIWHQRKSGMGLESAHLAHFVTFLYSLFQALGLHYDSKMLPWTPSSLDNYLKVYFMDWGWVGG